MALFGTKKEQEKKTAPARTASSGASLRSDYVHVLRSPRITEKASGLAERGAYVFDVDPRTTKEEVKKAVRAVYGLSPEKVAMTQVPAKRVFSRRGGKGVKAGGKKAIVYLKKGDSIEII